MSMKERIGTWGDDHPAYYITSTERDIPDYDSDDHPRDGPGGRVLPGLFSPREFRNYLTFEETDYSYAGRTSYEGEVMRANSLARANMTRTHGHPAGR